MRHIVKKLLNEGSSFVIWKKENEDEIKNWLQKKKADAIWDELGKTFGKEKAHFIETEKVKSNLWDSLYEEQHGLCCYCGIKLDRKFNSEKNKWEYENCSIEHFHPKNKHSDLVFDYSNLMLCCKESSKIKEYRITEHNTVEEIAKKASVSVEYVKKHIKEVDDKVKESTNINSKSIKEKVCKLPLPPHCDDSKSEFDSKPTETTIINPTKDSLMIEKLKFESTGKISVQKDILDSYKQITDNTLKVLALNCETLVERRKAAWDNTFKSYTTDILPLIFDDMQASIPKLIEGKSLPDLQNELDSFFFVEIAFYKSLFNGKID